MPRDRIIVGVVLAGGRSSRMGRNKALLDFEGRPLVEHMTDILGQTGVTQTVISGEVPGYDAIPDSEPHAGPARAILEVMRRLDTADALLVTPVDMPFLQPGMLGILAARPGGAHFENNPLPACIERGEVTGTVRSVRDLHDALGTASIALPVEYADAMKNINTPEDWKEATGQ